MKELPQTDWLSTPYPVRLFILRFLCEQGSCGTPITLATCNDLLQAYSYNYYQDHSLESFFNHDESTFYAHVLKLDGYLIAYDGDSPMENAWFHTVRSIKKQLATPFVHEVRP